MIRRLGAAVQTSLVRHREDIVDRQLVHERVAWAAMEIFAAACTLSRWDDERSRNDRTNDAVAQLLIADSMRRADACLSSLKNNNDPLIFAAAKSLAS